MKYVADWDKTQKRFEAFWECELVDRCCISIQAPRYSEKGYDQIELPEKYEDRIAYWTDGENILSRHIRLHESTYFAGDAFPTITLNFGPSGHAGFYKDMKFQFEDSVWFFPLDIDWEAHDSALVFDQNSFLYNSMINVAKYLADNNRDRYIIGNPHFSGDGDALAHLRGSQNFMVDLATQAPYIHPIMQNLQETWFRAYDAVHEIIKYANHNITAVSSFRVMGQGRVASTQCDLACMISNGQYEEYFLPYLKKQLAYVDKGFYHLDGCEQLRHLDSLLSIQELKAIQWQVVEGQPSPVHFISELKKIQAAGKGIILFVKDDELEPIMSELSSKGLFLSMNACSQQHADEIIKLVETLTHE